MLYKPNNRRDLRALILNDIPGDQKALDIGCSY